MNQPILSVRFFRTDGGNEPVREFLRDLAPDDRKIIGTDIKEVWFWLAAGHAAGAQDGKGFMGSS